MIPNANDVKSVIILAEVIGGIPTVAQICKALGDSYEITVAGPDGTSGAARLGVPRGVDLFSTAGIAKHFRRCRSAVSGASPTTSAPVTRTFDWLRYLVRFCARAVPALVRLLFERPPTLLVCVDALYLPVARIAAAIWRRPYVYVMIEIYPNQDLVASLWKRKIAAWVESFGLTSVSGVLVPDATFARLLRIRYRLPHLRARTIMTCPTAREIRHAPSAAKDNLPLKVYYHGMFSPNRGLETLILAMKYTNNAVLSLRGFGVAEEMLRELVRQEALSDKVIFLSPVPREELTGSAVGHEVGVVCADGGLGNGRFAIGFKTYEYMAAGLALLVPPSRPLRPLIKRTETGLLYRFGDAQSIADGINRFASDRCLLARCMESSCTWAESTYNEAVQAEAIRASIFEMRSDGPFQPRKHLRGKPCR